MNFISSCHIGQKCVQSSDYVFTFFLATFFFIFVASRHHFESIPHYDGLEIKVDLIVVGIFRPPWLNWCSAAWLYAETFLLAP